MQNPKVLTFDIETSPIVAHVWGLRDQNISLNQIVKDWQVIAFAAKWLGAPAKDICYADTRKMSEKALLVNIWKLLDQADIVITQNGQNFDSRKLNARFIEYGMKPPKPYRHLDTYKIAKAAAEFTSHKLEYLTDKLCTKYKKLSHKKFPGMSLWNECLKGNIKAWNEMKIYNIHDVLSTEELYLKLQAWTPKIAPVVSLTGCVSCGSHSLEKRGIDMTLATKWQRLHCKSCGKWQRGEKIKKELSK
jgi:DNA polymerase elongation subunit (family B)